MFLVDKKVLVQMPQFIYTMKGLGKAYPPDQVVFKDIWLSFYYGAKIGIIGSNGIGKSTLLKIMAGLDPNYMGEAVLTPWVLGRLSRAGAWSSTRRRRCWATSKRAWRRFARCSIASTRSMRSSAKNSLPRKWTESSKSRPKCRTRSTRPAPGIWTRRSNRRWMRCACLRPMPT